MRNQTRKESQTLPIENNPITRDNKIVFINHGKFIRHPSERKTPPPPKWGEEDNPGYDPREPFYDARKDPHTYTVS